MSAAPSLSALIQKATTQLRAAGVDDPARDARLLIAHALGCDRLALATNSERVLSENETAAIEEIITRREAREPVHRILGCREFWGLPFALNEATLEPRPDSETLIEVALNFFATQPNLPSLRAPEGGAAIHLPHAPPESPSALSGDGLLRFARNDKSIEPFPSRLLDLGTGTGCLLLSLLHEWPDATGLGIDKAPRAIEQATLNAQRLGLDTRAVFRVGDWLDGVEEKFDLILCNPPYIPSREIGALQPEVREYDPTDALDGGIDGLNPYRHLIPLLPRFLSANGVVLFEVGIGQAQDVAAMMEKAAFKTITITDDLGGVPRCVSGTIG